ncbi:glycosyltransferase family 4 protein [Salsipaludibacter albus]|uniref:glycosyltransferase family 4 protein n=1 Tax=Salsipaludibacter albus TaxID=2849650 RepID=UPI001EE4A09A|nr:glycosyltransferase family 4 protein [Salsipaludibacter albus]
MPGRSRTRVAAVVAVPPPIDGMTLVTARAVDVLHAEFAGVHVATIGARDGQSAWSWRLERQARFLVHGLGLTRARLRGLDVVYLVSDSRFGLPRVLAQVAMCRSLGVPVVLHHHVARYVNAPSRLMAAITRVGGDTVTHVLLCERLRAGFAARYPAPRTVVLHNDWVGEDEEAPTRRRHHETDDDVLTLGMLGNLTADKGTDTFCAVMDDLLTEGHRLRAVIAGPTADRASTEAVATLRQRHPDAVDHLGPVHGVAKRRFFAALDVFVLPTRYDNEAEPLVIHEALHAGVPVVATDRGCIPGQVGDRGWIVSDGADLARVLAEILRQPSRLAPRRAAIARATRARQPWATRFRAILEQAAGAGSCTRSLP